MNMKEAVALGLGLRKAYITESKAKETLEEADIAALEKARRHPCFAEAAKNLDYHNLRALFVATSAEPVSKLEARAKKVARLISEGKIKSDLRVSKRLLEGGGLGDPALEPGGDEFGTYPDNKDVPEKPNKMPPGKSYADERRAGAKGRRLKEDDSPLKPETPGEGDAGKALTSPTQAPNSVDVKEADDGTALPEPGDGSFAGDEMAEEWKTPEASDVTDGEGATVAEEDEENIETDEFGNPIGGVEEAGAMDTAPPPEPSDLDMRAESVLRKLSTLRVERKAAAKIAEKRGDAPKPAPRKLREDDKSLPNETPEADKAADYDKLEKVSGTEDYGGGKGKIERKGPTPGKRLKEDDSPLKPEKPGEGSTGPEQTSPCEDPDSVEVKERYRGLNRTERAAVLYLKRAGLKEGTDAWKRGFKQYVRFVAQPVAETAKRAPEVPARRPFRGAVNEAAAYSLEKKVAGRVSLFIVKKGGTAIGYVEAPRSGAKDRLAWLGKRYVAGATPDDGGIAQTEKFGVVSWAKGLEGRNKVADYIASGKPITPNSGGYHQHLDWLKSTDPASPAPPGVPLVESSNSVLSEQRREVAAPARPFRRN